MAHDHHQVRVPRGAIVAATLLITFSLGLAAWARSAKLGEPTVSPAPRESVALRFEDRSGGELVVLDAATSRELTVIAPGTNGFVRGVLRGMFRTRKLESMPRDARFVLSRNAQGRLSLDDPESGRHVDLDSFGPTNAAAFAVILESGARR